MSKSFNPMKLIDFRDKHDIYRLNKDFKSDTNCCIFQLEDIIKLFNELSEINDSMIKLEFENENKENKKYTTKQKHKIKILMIKMINLVEKIKKENDEYCTYMNQLIESCESYKLYDKPIIIDYEMSNSGELMIF